MAKQGTQIKLSVSSRLGLGKFVASSSYILFSRFPAITANAAAGIRLASREGKEEVFAPFTDSVEEAQDNEKEAVADSLRSYSIAKRNQSTAAPAYLPGGGWSHTGEFPYVASTEPTGGEIVEWAAYLRNFFRTNAISGMWDEPGMIFSSFSKLSRAEAAFKNGIMNAHYRSWLEAIPSADLGGLDAPHVGNPWGYMFKGHLLYEPVFEYSYQAHYINGLLAHLNSPVVLEIGGGFGGLAYHLLRNRGKRLRYVGIELPEKMLLQAYYLRSVFPDSRIFSYDGSGWPKNAEDYDVILLPNYVLPGVPSSYADMVLNFRSLPEMSLATITEYIRQIDRIGRLFFYHENIYKARGDGGHGIPTVDFPPLSNFTLIFSAESRWLKYGAQSPYPCHENLLIRNEVLEEAR